MGSSRSNILCFLVICASFLVPTSCHSYSHDALFIFGDSLYDAGNNIYLNTNIPKLNVFPYGMTYFEHPTGRISDGRLIPDFIAEFAKLPLIPLYLQPGDHKLTYGVNFASGGAGALAGTNQGLVLDLQTQLSNFKNTEKQLRQKLGASEVKALLSTAVYMFSIGTNDYMIPFTTNSTVFQSYSKKEYVKMVIGNITSVIQEIYSMGGRKFGLSKLLPLGCTPISRGLNIVRTGGSGCLEEVTVLAKLHNRALPKALKELKSQLKGYTYSVFDAYTVADALFNSPSKYGFEEVKKACCGSGPFRGSITCGQKVYQLCDNVSEYFFFDGIHPTEKANYQFAKLMWDGSPKIVKPFNLKTLFEK
ncbi:GDSL-LIKE LIPASE/ACYLHYDROLASE [Salix koriyanagi]|uniref:GDSL-LIKE LIPASE/ACYLHYDROLASE n=1 Tax=Salix koriyanagi TaxID=2511006 RepID=A0A9Q1ALX0_9ROSI|nr:GDSL-LIKE LIPASE/ACYLHYDROLASE [Salix koriyanagi]